MKNQSTLLSFLALFFVSGTAFSQLLVDNSITPEAVVNDFLLGDGINAYNITFNGQPADAGPNVQIGSFNAENAVLGMPEGLLMASGNVEVAIGPNNSGSASMPVSNAAAADPDLAALNPGFSLNDIAILEFDFIPDGDTVRFNYIFGSEEYPEFVFSSYNDVFGFFISGPGINGPYTNNAINIATIPGTNLPVTIDNVNNVVNTQFYTDNTGAPMNDPQFIQFDGYTVVLEALAQVQCGEEYHIKIALADAGDPNYDSGVFLEKGSFSSNVLVDVSVNPVIGGIEIGDGSFNDGIVAGCTDAQFCMFRPDTVGIDTAYFSLGGSAEAGIHYEPVLDTMIVFPAGVDTICIDIISLATGLGAQIDSLVITTSTINACGDTLYNSANIAIYNEYNYDVITEDIVVDCPTDLVDLSGYATGGLPTYSYEWIFDGAVISDQQNTSVLPPTDGQTNTYTLSVVDACGLTVETATLSVTDNVQPDPIITFSPADTINCVGQTVLLVGEGSLGQGELSYSWSNGGSSPQTTVEPDGSQTVTYYYLTVTDDCGVSTTDSIGVYFIPLDPPIANAGANQTVVCDGDLVTLSGAAEGGAAPYSYSWGAAGNTQSIEVSPEQTTTYYLTVVDACGGQGMDSVQVVVPIYDPISIDLTQPTQLCPGDEQLITSDASGGAGNYTYSWGNGETTSFISVAPTTPNNSYTLTVTDQCGTSNSATTSVIVPIFQPIVAVPGSTPSCTGEAFTLFINEISGGAGETESDYTYVWLDPENEPIEGVNSNGLVTIKGGNTGTYSVLITDACGNSATANVEANLVGIEYIPNIITPNNGDDINDKFVVPGSSIFKTQVTIMDRWGKVAFESTDYRCDQLDFKDPTTLIDINCWDGDKKKGDVFYYMIDVDNGTCMFQGTLHILDNQ